MQVRGQGKPWLWSRSFRFKLMVTSIVCILVPAFITLLLYNVLTKDAVKQEAILQSQQKLQLVDGYVSNLFDYMLYIGNTLQNDPKMQIILKAIAAGKSYEGPDAEYERYMDRSQITNKIETMTAHGDKAYVSVILKDGSVYTNYSLADFDPHSLQEEAWFPQLDELKGLQSFWIGTTPTVFPDEKKNSPYQISMARTLRAGVKPYGYVIVTIMETQVSTIFERVADEQETMLLSANGEILSDHDSGRIGQLYHPQETEDKGTDTKLVQLDEESYIQTTQLSALTGWRLVSLTPYKAAVHKLNSIFNKVAALLLVSFVVFLLLFLSLLGSFTKPLVRLGKMAETVERGNLEVRSNIRGKDEIGYLGQSFDQMLDRIKQMIAEITRTQTRKRKAELAMLQAQINPHFLFNVLNSIRMKVMRKGDQESAEMISSLSKLLRMTIIQEKGLIPLEEELAIIADYMLLMNMRQKQQVELDIDAHPETLQLMVPRFFMQPIIENALIHGLSQREGRIEISAKSRAGETMLQITDDGRGMDDETLEQLEKSLSQHGHTAAVEGTERETKGGLSSIGLSNVHERMKMTYGEGFYIDIRSDIDIGTQITLHIPKQEVTGHD
ncbi:histidine kinase [Paenibacillus sp. HB172176]|uniref:cache domain-containing sensor histidine kinase n=1 Tax=Paenibacillus sp. HB172176 TaxID=2493690 RepID=UPI001439CA00|nr:histidine kinase [Paenibacillus sp. HB172176]